MMDYSRYIVDPWRGAKEAQAINMQNEQNAFARQQAQKRNALAEREFQASERQNALTNQYRNRQLGMIEQEKGMQLLSVQADVLGRALDSVTDEQSYQQFKNFMSQLGPMADTKLMRFITSQAPANYDPQVVERGKQFLSTLRQKPESGLTGTAKNLEVILGRKPTIQELQDFARETKPETKIEMPEEEKAYDKEMGKRYAEDYSEILRASNQAQDNKIRLNRAKGLVTRIETGALKPTTTAIKRVIADLGYDVSKLGLKDDVGLAQALNAVSIDLTMDTVSRTKGAVSNKEMELFAQVAPQLSNTVEGNLLIIEMAQRLNENKIKVAQLARTYTQRNKRFDDRFYSELDKFHTENPLFTDDIYKRVQELAGAAKEAQGRGIVNPPTPNLSDVPDDELLKQLGM